MTRTIKNWKIGKLEILVWMEGIFSGHFDQLLYCEPSWLSVITECVRSKMGRLCFDTCLSIRLSVHTWGGGTLARFSWGCTPHQTWPEGYQMEYLICRGWYASCVHAGGLSCYQKFHMVELVFKTAKVDVVILAAFAIMAPIMMSLMNKSADRIPHYHTTVRTFAQIP